MIGMMGKVGCNPQWEHELRKLSRAALLDLVDTLLFSRLYYLYSEPDALLKLIRQSKKMGRFDEADARFKRRNANPEKEYATEVRRKRSAKAAARRRKAEARRAAKEAR